NGAFLARLAGIGMARCAIGRRLEMRIAEAAIAALRDGNALADQREIGKQCLAVFLVDLRPDRNLEHDVLAVGAGAILAHAVPAALRLEVLLVTIVDERIEAIDGFDEDAATIAAVTAVGAAEFNEFLAAERHAAVPARAGCDIDLGFIEEFHVSGYIVSPVHSPKSPVIKLASAVKRAASPPSCPRLSRASTSSRHNSE